ncbi:MAG: hypothetical protein HS100_04010 [Anaerolineales bacterium]|nr:hypothetical protein [Anaerolineales bacterium]
MHLTDQELNEYLDNESANRAEIETHLDSCDECAARLSALQALFADLDSLPEVELSTDIAARFAPRPSLTPSLPRWLTLTASLQAAAALVALIVAIPFFSIMLPQVEMPSFTSLFIEVQSKWITFLDMLSTFHFPQIEPLPLPVTELSTLFIALAIVSIFWIFGNGLLLRNQNR